MQNRNGHPTFLHFIDLLLFILFLCKTKENVTYYKHIMAPTSILGIRIKKLFCFYMGNWSYHTCD